MLGAAAPVPVPAGVSGMLLAVLEDEERNTSPLRRRFLGQLFFHSALLTSTLIVFIFLLRRSYRSLLAAEDRLRHQETMAALGSASQLIAHEVKNALNGIQAALSLLRPATSSGEVALPALRAQVQRLGHLARSLLSFGEPRPMLRRPCELRLLADEALQSVRLLPEAEDVRIGVSMKEGLTVHVDPALLVAAIDNLVRNAVEAGAVAARHGPAARALGAGEPRSRGRRGRPVGGGQRGRCGAGAGAAPVGALRHRARQGHRAGPAHGADRRGGPRRQSHLYSRCPKAAASPSASPWREPHEHVPAPGG